MRRQRTPAPGPIAALLLALALLLPAAAGSAGAAELAAPATAPAPPHVVLVAQNNGTEITDLLVPYAVLAEAGARVTVAAPEPGNVALWPALQLISHTTLAAAPAADLVVVPAVRDPEDARLRDWLQAASRAGTRIASICDGVLVLAAAGLLDGRRATGHFYSYDKRVARYPAVDWVRDARFVADGPFLTTAGVSASAPAAVHLAGELLGDAAAARAASRYGIDPSPAHDSAQFAIGPGAILTAAGNYLLGLVKRPYAIASAGPVDEFSLAFTVDMLARTSRARVSLDGDGTVTTRHGLRLEAAPATTRARRVQLPPVGQTDPAAALVIAEPALTLPRLLDHIGTVFGRRTADFVALQLEMPR